jgi:translation factor GUF1, mitochondrial
MINFPGIQAQTVANFDLAKKQGLTIIPVLNKIDLKNADPEGCAEQINTVFNIPKEDILKVMLCSL